MDENKVIIYDCQLLVDLYHALEYAADSWLRVIPNVDAYLDNCVEAFEKQRKIIQDNIYKAGKDYNVAEEHRIDAEEAYRSCRSSQRWKEIRDEDGHSVGGYYTPSCDGAEAALKAAEKESQRCKKVLDNWKKRDDEAYKIISECRGEIRDYRFVGSSVLPPGGRTLLESLCKTTTKEACQALNDVFDFAEKYLGREIYKEPVCMDAVDYAKAPAVETPSGEHTDFTKADVFKAATEMIQARQSIEASENKVAIPTAAAFCKRCHRPLSACVCARLLERTR